MKLDTSAAPELDLLARGPDACAPATVGNLAACLRLLEADPRSWWDLVRFDPDRPVRVHLAAPRPGCEAWLLVLPPGFRGDDQPEPSQPEPSQPEPSQPDPSQPDPSQPEPRQPEPSQPGPSQLEPAPGQEVACLVAGAITEHASTPNTRVGAHDTEGRPLLPGRIRVRGREPRRVINSGSGYAVSLHARALAR